MHARIRIDENYCKGCGLCVEVCPRSLIVMSCRLNAIGVLPAEISEANMTLCAGCTLCAQICPDVAITVYRESA